MLFATYIFKQQPVGKYNAKFIRLSFFGLIASNLHVILYAIQYIFINIDENRYGIIIFGLGDTFSEIFYILSCIFVYLVFLTRIQMAFEGTKYQIPNYIAYICYIVMIIMFLLKLMDSTMDALDGKDMLSVHWSEFWNTFYFATLEITDLLLSIILIIVFSKKLINVTVDLADDCDNCHSIQLNESQTGLLNIVIKHFILSMTSVISTQIYFCFLSIIMILNEFENFRGTNGEILLFGIAFIFWALDSLINCLCICMNLDFNHQIYYILCGKCHTYCKLWCSSRTKSKIARKIKNKELNQHLLSL
eukprot:75163_1